MRPYLLLGLITLLFIVSGFSRGKITSLPPRIITITINENGLVYMGRDTMVTGDLAVQLQERLWRSYLGNGKMYDSLQIIFNGNVMMGEKGAALDAIRLAQQNALKDICLQKYNRRFESLDSRQQKKLRKQFPILFQELHW